MAKVVIVGGGISGLALAYRLGQRDPHLDITVLEKEPRPGGTVWTERDHGFQVETGPNGFLDTKPTTLELCRELGLADRLIPASAEARTNRYLLLDGRLRLLPATLPGFLVSGLMSWRGKVSFFLELIRPRRRTDADESIAAFARRRAGREAATVFADALVTGIFAGDPELLSVRACFPRLVALEEEHGSVLKGMARVARQRRQEALARGEPYQRPGTMWSLRDGLRLLIETLSAQLARPPLASVCVCGLTRQGDQGWTVAATDGGHWTADAVVLTCPAYQQASILAGLDQELAERIGGIAYNRIVVLALGYRRREIPGSVAGFGYIAPQRTRGDILGVQWCSSIYPERAPADAVLFRAMAGGWHRAEVAAWDDERLLERVRAELARAMHIRAAPIFQRIIRWPRAIPQYRLGHLERVAWIEERARRYPGLFLGGNAFHGVALNDCTEQAEILAGRVYGFLQGRPSAGADGSLQHS
jgi:oxygen-dependent protoporphyrinogen oxidase